MNCESDIDTKGLALELDQLRARFMGARRFRLGVWTPSEHSLLTRTITYLLAQDRETETQGNTMTSPIQPLYYVRNADGHFVAAHPQPLELSRAAVQHAVQRFLSWKLPESFWPDCYIAFNKALAQANNWPTGTNLLSAREAQQMLEHMLGLDDGRQAEPDVTHPAEPPVHQHPNPDPAPPTEHDDGFRGDTPHLIRCIQALLELDSAGVLSPHGIGGHARTMLAAAASRLGRG